MPCEDIESRITSLQRQHNQLEVALGALQGAGLARAQENLQNIAAQIAAEKANLAACLAAAAGETMSASFNGFVGTIESETRGTARLWFSLTSESSGANWLKVAGKRVWLTMNLESADRPSHMAQLTLLLEAMRNALEVEVGHDGVASGFHKIVEGDSYEINGLRILRKGLSF